MTLLQQWTEFKYYGDQVVRELEQKGYKEGHPTWGGLSQWLVGAMQYYWGDQFSPAEAADDCIASLSKDK